MQYTIYRMISIMSAIKLSFAMDAERGIHFLHTIETPQRHRNLKSDNLVVSRE